MQAFADLLDQLEMDRRPGVRRRHLEIYFRATADPDRGMAAALLTGRLTLQKLGSKPVLDQLTAKCDPVLMTLSSGTTRDALEALALSWPEYSNPGPTPRLADLVFASRELSKAKLIDRIPAWLDGLDDRGRWALLKLFCGGRDLAVAPTIVVGALADLGGLRDAEVHEVWRLLEPPFEDLFDWLDGRRPKPAGHDALYLRGFADTGPATMADLKTLPAVSVSTEWKWRGVRAQWATSGGLDAAFRVTDRSGRDLTGRLPELSVWLDQSAVLDGQLIAMRDGAILEDAVLQRRLRRQSVSKDALKAQPIAFRAFDLLMLDGQDVRSHPYQRRRQLLETLIRPLNSPAIDLTEARQASDWSEVESLLQTPPPASDGVIIKPLADAYGDGSWKALRAAPKKFLGVMLYAQPLLRSSGLEVTVGVWRKKNEKPELVPVGKAATGSDGDFDRQLADFIKSNTINRFGPVREVVQSPTEGMVLEIAFDGLERAARRKAGLLVRGARIMRIADSPPIDAADLDWLTDQLPAANSI